jgi:hypothetical protein
LKRGTISRYLGYVKWRAPLVGYNAAVIHKELTTYFGYTGGYTCVKEAVRPLRSQHRACVNIDVEVRDLKIYETIGGYSK